MFAKLEMVHMAHDLARHSAARLGVIAENVAHADTPRYKARDIKPFAEVYQERLALRTSREGHFQEAQPVRIEAFATDDIAAPNGNSVSLEQEMVKGAQARQQHDVALSIYRATSNLLRSALGRTGG